MIADQIQNDNHISQSLSSVAERLYQISSSLDGIRPANPELLDEYQKTLDEFACIRAGKLFFPYLASGAGHGPFVELLDGSVKYDFTCGIGVHICGHSHPKVIEASLRAGLEDVTMQGNLQQSKPSMVLSRKILDMAQRHGADLEHCFLTSSGVMAGENALKMALQKNHPAARVLAFERCFAGRSLAFSQINDKPAFRDGLPEILNVDYVPFYDHNDPEGSIDRAVKTLTAHLSRHPGHHAAMIFELIQGEGGFHLGTTKFHRALMDVCREHKVAVLVDEVQTFARTHHPFAFQEFGLDELVDIVWIGKASQVCATLFRKDFAPRPGLVAQTYTSSSATIAASLAILTELDNGNYFGKKGKSAKLHAFFVEKLEGICQRHPTLLEGPFGIAAMTGCTPYKGDQTLVIKLVHKLYERGVIAFLAGIKPTRLRFLLPIGALEEKHITETATILEKCLLEVAAELNS